jgi:hypothetical protein
MSLQDRARFWNATAEEREATYPCDGFIVGPREGFVRAIDVEAPAEAMFRWLCQLKIGPYSYNPLNTKRRRSPRSSHAKSRASRGGPGLLVFRIVAFEPARRHRLLSPQSAEQRLRLLLGDGTARKSAAIRPGTHPILRSEEASLPRHGHASPILTDRSVTRLSTETLSPDAGDWLHTTQFESRICQRSSPDASS